MTIFSNDSPRIGQCDCFPLQSAERLGSMTITIILTMTIIIIITIIKMTSKFMRELVRVLFCLYEPTARNSRHEDAGDTENLSDWLLTREEEVQEIQRGIQREVQQEIQREVQQEIQREIQQEIQRGPVTLGMRCEIPPPVPPKIPLTAERSVQRIARGAPAGTATATWSHPVAISSTRLTSAGAHGTFWTGSSFQIP